MASTLQVDGAITSNGLLTVDGSANSSQAIFTGTAGRGLEISTESVGAADEGVIFDATASGTTGKMTFQTNGATSLELAGNGGTGTFHQGLVVNEDSAASGDFRVESNDNANMLFVDSGNNRVGIAQGTPVATLFQVGGDVATTRTPTMSISGADSGGTDTSLVVRGGSPTLVFDQSGGGNTRILMDSAYINFLSGTLDSFGNNVFSLASSTGQETVFNQDSLNIDFRVESDGNASMLFVDAGNNKVSMGDVANNYGSVLTIHDDDNGETPSSLYLRNSGTSSGSGARIESGYVTGYGAAIKFTGNPSNARPYSIIFERITAENTYVTSGEFGTGGLFKSYAGAVFNESSEDVDFRVESNGQSHMLFVDAGADAVMFNKSSTATSEVGTIISLDGAGARLNLISDNDSSNAMLLGTRNDTGANVLLIRPNGNLQNANNSYAAISDVNKKENIADASSQWEDIKALRVRKYSMIADPSPVANQIGVIAQEVEAAGMGGLVETVPDIYDSTQDDISVKYSILYMKAVKALQEAMTRIETLEAKVTALENA
jgi:hypothetical protein